MNPPNNIQNGFFTPVSPFFRKIRKLTVFSRNPHTPIIPQSVRLRMGRGRVIRAEKPPFVPFSRRSGCSACPRQFFGHKKNHMPGACGACRAYDWDLIQFFHAPPRPPSSREGDRPQAVEGVRNPHEVTGNCNHEMHLQLCVVLLPFRKRGIIVCGRWDALR